MEDYDRYITVEEAAKRLERTEPEILRMLESGVLPAVLRGALKLSNGESRGFDYALLPVEGVRRVVDHGGDDFTLEWEFCGGLCKAECFPARKSSIRVFWLPEYFPELLPSSAALHAVSNVAPSGATLPKFDATEKAEMVTAYNHGRGVSVSALARQFGAHRRTIDDVLIAAGAKRGKRR